MINKKYDEAVNWMEKFYKLKPDNSRAKAFMPILYIIEICSNQTLKWV